MLQSDINLSVNKKDTQTQRTHDNNSQIRQDFVKINCNDVPY